MAYNSLATAKKYGETLDKILVAKSATGFLTDNSLREKFVGAKQVVISDVDFIGLADYDRDTGFTKGPISLEQTVYELTKDRARSLQLDREDADESGISNLAGQIMGEYVRTKVVPEMDAFVLSKIAGYAAVRGNTVDRGVAYPFKNFNELLQNAQNVAGYDEEMVCFIANPIYSALMNSSEISRYITVSDFKQGEINLKVKSINGVSLIPVQTSRMFAQYTFSSGSKGASDTSSDGASGGFLPNSTGKSIFMLVMPKRAASLVKKTEKVRVFSPDENLTADAWKFDYRVYYDVFVKKSMQDTVWVWFSPTVTFGTDLAATASKTAGAITGTTTTVAATASNNGTVTYQYYLCDDADKTNARKAGWSGNNTATMTYDTGLVAGTYYLFCRASADGLTYNDSTVQKLTVS